MLVGGAQVAIEVLAADLEEEALEGLQVGDGGAQLVARGRLLLLAELLLDRDRESGQGKPKAVRDFQPLGAVVEVQQQVARKALTSSGRWTGCSAGRGFRPAARDGARFC